MRASASALVGTVVLAACTDTTPRGDIRVCFAAEGASEMDALRDGERRTGLRVVDDDVEPPDAFDECARGIAETASFIDDGGERVWLGVDANVDGADLVAEGVLSGIEDASLVLQFGGGVGRTTSLVVRDADGVVIALQSARRFDDDGGLLDDALEVAIAPLVVENAGAAALPVLVTCGPQQALKVRFVDGAAAHDVANGESTRLEVGGRELRATNVHSADFTGTTCEDGPSGPTTTWIVTRSAR